MKVSFTPWLEPSYSLSSPIQVWYHNKCWYGLDQSSRPSTPSLFHKYVWRWQVVWRRWVNDLLFGFQPIMESQWEAPVGYCSIAIASLHARRIYNRLSKSLLKLYELCFIVAFIRLSDFYTSWNIMRAFVNKLFNYKYKLSVLLSLQNCSPHFEHCLYPIIIIIIIIAPLTIVNEDQWGDLECLYKAC